MKNPMNIFSEFPDQARGRAVLLSIKPKYAEMIFSGGKRVELRRTWPIKTKIDVIVVYSSSPVQKLVGVVFIDRIEEHEIKGLWNLAATNGGGVTYDELKLYTKGKEKAYGVVIDRVKSAEIQITPKFLFPAFTPPQFFLYLKPEEYWHILRAMFPSENII
jgi:predicted transcriptional regulator